MEVQDPSLNRQSRALFGAALSEAEHVLLESLSAPRVAEVTTELAHLRNLGLIFIDARTGCAQVTPLGKSWLRSQRRLRS